MADAMLRQEPVRASLGCVFGWNEIRMCRVSDSDEICSCPVPCSAPRGAGRVNMSRPFSTHSTGFERGRGVTAVLGPTNTGKTHLAIERMLAHDIGIIGLPLRLLAREVYDKIVARAGAAQVALITGEEKIKPPS